MPRSPRSWTQRSISSTTPGSSGCTDMNPTDPVRTERRHRREAASLASFDGSMPPKVWGAPGTSRYAEDEGPVHRPHVAQVVVTAVGQRDGAVGPHDAVHDLIFRGHRGLVGGQMSVYVDNHGTCSGDYTRRPTAEPPLHPVQWAFSLPQKVVTISAIHFNRSYRRKPVSSPRWQDSRDATQRHATLERPCAKVQALDPGFSQAMW